MQFVYNDGGLPAGAEAYYDNTSQNIGFGTNAPSRDLHIQKSDSDLLLESVNDSWTSIYIKNSGAAEPIDVRIEAARSVENYGALGTHSNNDLLVQTNALERIRIKNSGNVGIGTDNPSALLHVNGDFRLQSGAAVSEIQTSIADSDDAVPTSGAVVDYLSAAASGLKHYQWTNVSGETLGGGSEQVLTTLTITGVGSHSIPIAVQVDGEFLTTGDSSDTYNYKLKILDRFGNHFTFNITSWGWEGNPSGFFKAISHPIHKSVMDLFPQTDGQIDVQLTVTAGGDGGYGYRRCRNVTVDLWYADL